MDQCDRQVSQHLVLGFDPVQLVGEMLASGRRIPFHVADGSRDAVRAGAVGRRMDLQREIGEQARYVLLERAGYGVRDVVIGRHHDGAIRVEQSVRRLLVQHGDRFELLSGHVGAKDLRDGRVHESVRLDHGAQRVGDAVIGDLQFPWKVLAFLQGLDQIEHGLNLLPGSLRHSVGLSFGFSFSRRSHTVPGCGALRCTMSTSSDAPERKTAGTRVPETVVRVSMGPVPAACSGLEGDLGQRVPWRAVTSIRRRFMSSTVQPMPVRATAARSMPFVFAPVDAMT